ncbi:unnamed protein product, partial [Mesorhabditis belari]|uniref:Uncharacterized protein n=1 Tax=Mesorhabditis belari TaxID=2138241 RepID=A0AAF3FFE6_9BILA
MSLRVLVFSLFHPEIISSFIFGSNQEQDFCYQLDLENCFRDIFMAVMLPPERRVREVPLFANANFSRFARGQPALRNLMLCHDVRRIAMCFTYPGCTDEMASHVAAVQYHMVFGKKLPSQVFLSYRGYGKQVCDQGCSQFALNECKSKMKANHKDDESMLRNLEELASSAINSPDSEMGCRLFKRQFKELLRERSGPCSHISKCTCMEPTLKAGLSHCNVGCEHEFDAPDSSNSLNSSISLIFFVFLRLLF